MAVFSIEPAERRPKLRNQQGMYLSKYYRADRKHITIHQVCRLLEEIEFRFSERVGFGDPERRIECAKIIMANWWNYIYD